MGAVVLVLLAIFAPLAWTSPALPLALPRVRFDAGALLREHEQVRPAERLSWLQEAFDRMASLAAERNETALAPARRAFGSLLLDAAGDDASARQRQRARFANAFLDAALRADRSNAMVRTADRHGLLGPDSPSRRAMLLAWFDFRFEMYSSREYLRGEVATLPSLLGRIPMEERRAFTAWALSAECAALLAQPPAPELAPADARRCASVRRDFSAVAARLEPSYPAEEARAAVEVLLARDLRLYAREHAAGEERSALLQDARDRMTQAHGFLTELAARDPSRWHRRLVVGALRALDP